MDLAPLNRYAHPSDEGTVGVDDRKPLYCFETSTEAAI
jgi:hypothetical protein